MPYKHIEDRRAYQRQYYKEHREQRLARSAAWYEAKRQDPEYMKRKREYQRGFNLRKRLGL